MGLNKMQQVAVETINGPLLILAGAGSGKTTVIVERIKHLVENEGVDPASIVAITFTNKAAQEMKHRALRAIKQKNKHYLELTTFHSLCLKMLKKESVRTNQVNVGFKLYTPDDVQIIIKQIIKEIGGQYTRKNEENYINYRSVQNKISTLKNELVDAKTFLNEKQTNKYQDWKEIDKIIKTFDTDSLQTFQSIYMRYETHMKNYNALDFDDLLLKTANMFLEDEQILKKYQQIYKYIMIDEYQDTNRAQYAIVKQLAQLNRNLAVVGDDYQSIYRFRGSDIRNILDFDKDFPDAKIIKLEQNYRSTKSIIKAANAIISNNVNQRHKQLFTENEEGERIRIVPAENEFKEAEYISTEIFKLVSSGKYNYDDIAILYRSNRKSALVEKEFNMNSIPHRILSGKSFFDRSEVKDIIYYIRFILEPNDAVFFQRIVNTPKRGIGTSSVNKVIEASLNHDMLDVMEDPSGLKRINNKTKEGLKEFAEMIRRYRSKMNDVSVSSLLEELIAEIDLIDLHYFNETNAKIRERKESLEQLIIFAKEREKQDVNLTLEKFVDELVLDPIKEDSEKGYVKMMTAHASKGLEFPVVFLIGMDQETFPSKMAYTNEDIEEERRLAYVAFTRAKKNLYVVYPEQSFSRDKEGILNASALSPSMFIKEVPKEYISIVRI